jgi:hypothetical protein
MRMDSVGHKQIWACAGLGVGGLGQSCDWQGKISAWARLSMVFSWAVLGTGWSLPRHCLLWARADLDITWAGNGLGCARSELGLIRTLLGMV